MDDNNYNYNNFGGDSPQQNNQQPYNQPDYTQQNNYQQPYNQPDYTQQNNYQQPYSQPDYTQQNNYQQPYGQPDYTQQYGNMQSPQYYPQPDNSRGMAIASLVMGIISFFCCGSILSILGIIFGAVSLSRKKQQNGMAVAGLIISCIAFVLWLVAIIFLASDGYFSGNYYYY